MGRPRQVHRYVVVIDWRTDVAGGQTEVFGTWRSMALAQAKADLWKAQIPERLECIVAVKRLRDNAGDDFADALAWAKRRAGMEEM